MKTEENQNPKQFPTNWINSDPSDLARHFYGTIKQQELSDSFTNQLVRVNELSLPLDSLLKHFTTGSKVKKVIIEMGFSSEISKNASMSFAPTFTAELEDVEDPIGPIAFIAPEYSSKKSNISHNRLGDSPIPEDLKQYLKQNWNQLDNSLIDDIFMAYVPPKNNTDTKQPIMSRLLRYVFKPSSASDTNGDINSSLIDLLNEITSNKNDINNTPILNSFTLHLGVDYNKLNHKDQFTFSPILELNYPTPLLSPVAARKLHRSGIRFILNDDDTETALLEYVRPCPSTCPDEE